MKDRVFSGPSVDEAVAVASRSLGLSPGALRYVVLDPGSPARLGVSATPTRIAVLADEPRAAAPTETRPAAEAPRAGVRRVLGAIVEAAGLDLAIEMEERDEALLVRFSGAGRTFFFGGQGEVLRAVEHLLQRISARDQARRLKVECEGYREHRDAELQARARELATAVRRDGRPQTTGPLNSYERRVVHLALSGEAGVTTYSLGEGSERRVMIAPATGDPASDEKAS